LNFRNHAVRFEEATAVFDDPYAMTIADDEAAPPEERFVSIGMGAIGTRPGFGLHIPRRQHPHHLGQARPRHIIFDLLAADH
jgi:uncharacterized DUF497 family protein